MDKKRATDLRGFPIEKVRLQCVVIFYPWAALCLLCFGCVLEKRANLAAPLILGFIMGFFLVASSNTMSSLLVDLYPQSPSTVTAANNLTRCWLSAAMAAAIGPMLNTLGWGWTFVLIGLLQLASLLILWPVWKYGTVWREERRVRLEKRKEAKEQRRSAKTEG